MGDEQVEHMGEWSDWVKTIAISAGVIALITVLLRLGAL